MKNITILLMIYAILVSPLYAGTWGVGVFENDDAHDWLNELYRKVKINPPNYYSYIEYTFDRVIINKAYIQVDDCGHAIAAGALVAYSMDENYIGLPPLAKKITKDVPESIRLAGAKAIDKCLNYKDSEIRQLWSESEFYLQWRSIITDLYRRLT